MKRDANQFRLRLSKLILALAIAAPALRVGAEGFRNPPYSTFGLGRAGGRVAQVDDASAVQNNPANLVTLTNAEFEYTPSIVSIAFHFQSSTVAQSANTKEPWKVLPNLYYATPIQDGKLIFGLGITVPYGLAVKWDNKSSAFSQTTPGIWTFAAANGAPFYTRLTTVNVNPTLAWKMSDNVSIGLGLDVMGSDLEFRQYVAPGGWWAKAYGIGIGAGANGAITWQMTDRQRIAVSIRSPMDVKYHGHLRQTGSPSGNISSSFDSEIKYPAILDLGYGWQVTPTVRVESDLELIEFSRFQTLPVRVGNNPYIPSQNIPEHWRDTYTVGVAGDWQVAPHWMLRGGYQFYETPVPEMTFSPTIPDANQNVITVGVAYEHGRHTFEAAYGYDFYDTRHIQSNQNPNFIGTYTFNLHLFSLAYHYKF